MFSVSITAPSSPPAHYHYRGYYRPNNNAHRNKVGLETTCGISSHYTQLILPLFAACAVIGRTCLLLLSPLHRSASSRSTPRQSLMQFLTLPMASRNNLYCFMAKNYFSSLTWNGKMLRYMMLLISLPLTMSGRKERKKWSRWFSMEIQETTWW